MSLVGAHLDVNVIVCAAVWLFEWVCTYAHVYVCGTSACFQDIIVLRNAECSSVRMFALE